MKNKLVATLLLSALLTACTQKDADTSNVNDQISQYLSLIDARRSPEPNLDRIKMLYTSLSDILTRSGLQTQSDQYLAQAMKNEHITPPLQGVEKTFQQALALLIHQELSQIQSDPEAAIQHIDQAHALYGGLRSTAERRGQYYGSDTLFTDIIEESFKGLRADTDLTTNIQKIYSAINDVYFLSILYELEGITAKRGVDEIIVKEKQIEAVIFYEIIHPSAPNKAASELVRAELAKDGNEIDTDGVKENLRIAFPEKSARYANKF